MGVLLLLHSAPTGVPSFQRYPHAKHVTTSGLDTAINCGQVPPLASQLKLLIRNLNY